MNRLGWGVIGAGGIADRRMIPEGILSAKNAKFVALMDADGERLKALAGKYAGARACKTETELLSLPEVQAVYIATPNHLHKRQCLQAIAAGKHVLCEKPLAMNETEGREIVAAAKKARVKLGIDYMMRYNVYHRWFAEKVRNGDVGTPVMARAQLTCWYPKIEGAWRQIESLGGGGAIVDLATHCVDLLELFFGRATHVFCVTQRRVQDYEVEDTSLMTLKFENGALGVVDCHFNIPDESSEYVLEVYGSRGCLKAAYTIGQGPGGQARCCLLGESGGYDAAQKQELRGYHPVTLEGPNTYQAIVEDFSDAVLGDRDFELSGEHGLWNLRLVEHAYESARTGRMIEIPAL